MTPKDLITASQKPGESCEPTIPPDVLFSAPMLGLTNKARCPGQQNEGSAGAAAAGGRARSAASHLQSACRKDEFGIGWALSPSTEIPFPSAERCVVGHWVLRHQQRSNESPNQIHIRLIDGAPWGMPRACRLPCI
jgi:hypothetical protein